MRHGKSTYWRTGKSGTPDEPGPPTDESLHGISPFQMHCRWTAIFALVALAVSVLAAAEKAVETPPLSEYQVKALFLFNFAKYVDWPADAFQNDGTPIVIGLVGQDSFGDSFQKITAGRSINGRQVVIKHVDNAEEYKTCQILFVSASEKDRLAPILDAVKDSAVLTVGESDGFLSEEGIINLTKKANKVRLEINLKAAQKARLQLSSRLLTVADVVVGKP